MTILFAVSMTYYTFSAPHLIGGSIKQWEYFVIAGGVLAALILPWRNDILSGITFVLISVEILLIMSIHFSSLAWIFYGPAYILAGMLMILAWFLSRKELQVKNKSP